MSQTPLDLASLPSRFDAIVNAAGTMIVATDLAGVIQVFNPAAERLLGWKRDEVVGRQSPLLWHDPKELIARAMELSRELDRVIVPGLDVFFANAQDDSHQPSSWTLIRRDGTRRPAQVVVSAIRDARESVAGYLWTAQDATPLVESERRHRTLLSNLQGMAYRCRHDADWTMEFVSSGCRELLGIEPSELTSGWRSFASLIHPDDLPTVSARCEAGIKSGLPIEQTYRVILPDGRTRWMWERARGVYRDDGSVEAIEGFISDCTDRREAEERLRHSEQRLSLAMEIGEFGIWDADLTTGVVLWNDYCFRQLGYPPSFDGKATVEMWRTLVLPDDLAAIDQATEHALRTRTLYSSVHRLFRADNRKLRWNEVSGRFFYNEQGQAVRLLGVSRDITERKHAEHRQRCQSQFFEMIAADAPLSQVLEAIALAVEFEDPAAYCSILLLDESGTRLLHGAGPSLPEFYSQAIHGVEIGECVGSCGTAAHSKQRVIAEDIATHPGWVNYRSLAEQAGLRACWSEPVISAKGTVLGTFAMYYRQPRSPDDEDVARIQWATHFVQLAIERRQAQATLAKTHAMYESLARVSPVGIVMCDPHGKLLSVNQRWEEMTGMTQAEALGDGWQSLIHPDDRERAIREWNHAVQTGSPFRIETRLRTANGEVAWALCQGVPLRDDQEQITGFIRVVSDMTEQKLTEIALRQLSTDLARLNGVEYYQVVARQLAEMVDCEMVFICRRDPDEPEMLQTTVAFIDGEVCPNFRYASEGTPCADVIEYGTCVYSQDVWQRFPQDTFLKDQRVQAYVGIPFLDSRGEYIGHLSVLARHSLSNPHNVETISKLFAVALVAEIERQTSERRFSDLFEFSPDAIVICNREGTIVQANRQTESLFGWKRGELIGQPVEVLMPHARRAEHVGMRQGYLHSATPRAMAGDRPNLRGLRKDGTTFPADISLSPMETEGGTMIAAAVRDITERQLFMQRLQATVAELQEANAIIARERETLEQRVRERTAELSTANDELVRASRFKSEFLATMSHELRTPLNGVLGMNELLLRTSLSDQQRRYVEACLSSGRSLLQLINDVLDLSKIESGQFDLDYHECQLEPLVYDVLAMFSHAAAQKNLKLTGQLDPELCVAVQCDDTRVRQILVNLIGNALKFTSSGGIRVQAKCQQRNQSRIVTRFLVSDTGIGIPAEKLELLFSPFVQIDSSTARQFGGTGLGLSICKQLTTLMGGRVGVESELGVGSTFWFELPLPIVADEASVAQRRKQLEGTRILAIDGLDRDRRQVADCLEAWGCRVDQVATLPEAFELLAEAEQQADPVKVILADCRLAFGDEYIHLQRLTERRDRPVIGLGAGESNDLANQLHQLGLRQLLRDPIRPSGLFDALSSVLAVKRTTEVTPPEPTVPTQLPTRFTGHVLVAEDNSINQMFVRELLKHCGCSCDIAENGIEAIAAVSRQRYDLVLMDCQMPEMDGFAASREIRCLEASGAIGPRLPIVALTANALKGDRELCLQAGMDDYLSKPLQAAQLQALLARYLTTPPAEESPSAHMP